MHTMFDGLKIGPGNPQDFLASIDDEHDDDDDVEELPAKKGTGKTKYKDEHIDVYFQAGIAWPPDMSLAPEIDVAGLTDRVREQVFYVHFMFKENALKRANGSVQFFDANYSLKRNLSWDEPSGAPTVEDPWKDLLPAITTKSVMIARFLSPDSKNIEVIKRISGPELMLFVGWPRQRLTELLPFSSGALTDFAGGAFAGFAVCPVVTVALYGAGKVGLTGDEEQEIQVPTSTTSTAAASSTGTGPEVVATEGAEKMADKDSDSSSSD
jgi:hypothetical protein